MKPAKHKFTILKQVMDHIPAYLVPKVARDSCVEKKCRTFSPWSHVVSMVFAQISHALSLNDICDTLRNQASSLATIRGAQPPSRNGLSHANKVRSSEMAKRVFYETLNHFTSHFPRFGRFDSQFKLSRRIKRTINIVDSTTISLFAYCMDWAKHRRRKAAAKCHMLLDGKSFLPRFAVIKTAKSSDAVNARGLCAPLQAGEIVIFDKAYVDFMHLFELCSRGIAWVTRAKDNMSHEIVRKMRVTCPGVILDAEIKLIGIRSRKNYPRNLRLIVADVERNGKIVRMRFITDNFDWSPVTITDLYKSRWDIELFFKQLKQTLKLSDFLGYSENAVQWQVWMALLTYVILRFIAYLSKWKGTFARLFSAVRGVVWSRFDLYNMLLYCGTAVGRQRIFIPVQQLSLPLFVR